MYDPKKRVPIPLADPMRTLYVLARPSMGRRTCQGRVPLFSRSLEVRPRSTDQAALRLDGRAMKQVCWSTYFPFRAGASLALSARIAPLARLSGHVDVEEVSDTLALRYHVPRQSILMKRIDEASGVLRFEETLSGSGRLIHSFMEGTATVPVGMQALAPGEGFRLEIALEGGGLLGVTFKPYETGGRLEGLELTGIKGSTLGWRLLRGLAVEISERGP